MYIHKRVIREKGVEVVVTQLIESSPHKTYDTYHLILPCFNQDYLTW